MWDAGNSVPWTLDDKDRAVDLIAECRLQRMNLERTLSLYPREDVRGEIDEADGFEIARARYESRSIPPG